MIVKLTHEFTERVAPIVWVVDEFRYKYERPWLVVKSDAYKNGNDTLLVYLTGIAPKKKRLFVSCLPENKWPDGEETWANCTNIVCVESGKDIAFVCDRRLMPLMGEMADVDRALRNALGL